MSSAMKRTDVQAYCTRPILWSVRRSSLRMTVSWVASADSVRCTTEPQYGMASSHPMVLSTLTSLCTAAVGQPQRVLGRWLASRKDSVALVCRACCHACCAWLFRAPRIRGRTSHHGARKKKGTSLLETRLRWRVHVWSAAHDRCRVTPSSQSGPDEVSRSRASPQRLRCAELQATDAYCGGGVSAEGGPEQCWPAIAC
eukprot:scaffold1919_cov394-Prasinococcus_capsulatus_cf.AAC.12